MQIREDKSAKRLKCAKCVTLKAAGGGREGGRERGATERRGRKKGKGRLDHLPQSVGVGASFKVK
jgi:hypothetical protein